MGLGRGVPSTAFSEAAVSAQSLRHMFAAAGANDAALLAKVAADLAMFAALRAKDIAHPAKDNPQGEDFARGATMFAALRAKDAAPRGNFARAATSFAARRANFAAPAAKTAAHSSIDRASQGLATLVPAIRRPRRHIRFRWIWDGRCSTPSSA